MLFQICATVVYLAHTDHIDKTACTLMVANVLTIPLGCLQPFVPLKALHLSAFLSVMNAERFAVVRIGAISEHPMLVGLFV